MGKTKIFVAGSWDNRTVMHDIIKQFDSIAEVTHDWTIHESEELLNNKVYLQSQVIVTCEAIEHSDLLIVIMDQPNYAYMGTWTEIGMALATNIPVLIFNPNNYCVNNLYMNHLGIKIFDNLNKLAEYVKNW